MIVADTNLIIHLVLPGDRSTVAREVWRGDAAWAAPVLWRSEFRNVLATLVRTGVVLLADAIEALALAESLLRGREYQVESSAVLRVATESGCSAYDAEFVVLAQDLGVRLVTDDRRLARAFPTVAVLPGAFARGHEGK